MDHVLLDRRRGGTLPERRHEHVRSRAAQQQPQWDDTSPIDYVRRQLTSRPPLVSGQDVRALRSALAEVAAGRALVLQVGDCAEDPAECTAAHVARKAGLLDLLAGVLRMNTRMPVIRVGRIAGQFAKPRSRPTERVGRAELPVFRGHMINGPECDPQARQPNAWRLLLSYHAANEVMSHLGWRGTKWQPDAQVWTSHEALLLDYELPMLRQEAGDLLLTSTHWPWIGERTRQCDGAHVAMLADVSNPVACKVGPSATAEEVVGLCERLDPHREPGRLTLIARMGAGRTADRLPALVSAVRAAGHPVVWLTDPMHGNTVTTAHGIKTRSVDTIVDEVRQFQRAVTAVGGAAGGMHLEATPDEVTECLSAGDDARLVSDSYLTLCDPRLCPQQAISVVSAWNL